MAQWSQGVFSPVTFEQFALGQRIISGIKSVGYTTPTPIQQQAIPIALEGRDLLGLAQTGTGKSAAFILPILQRLGSQAASRKVRALVVVPTPRASRTNPPGYHRSRQKHQSPQCSHLWWGEQSPSACGTAARHGGCHCLSRSPSRPCERWRHRSIRG